MRMCDIEGCNGKHVAKGLCRVHYMREWAARRRKDPTAPIREYSMDALERARKTKSKRDPETGCLLYTGALNASGYARVYTKSGERKNMMLHRLAYADRHGDIPDGHDVHHTCFVRHCFEPDHLEALSFTENRGKNRCVNCGMDPRIKGAQASHLDSSSSD